MTYDGYKQIAIGHRSDSGDLIKQEKFLQSLAMIYMNYLINLVTCY